MSSITYTALNPNNHSWMQSGDSLLEIDSGQHLGKCILVNVVQNNVDINSDGVDDQIAVKVTARLVNKTTGETILEGSSPVEIPAKVESALLSAISEGEIYVGNWIAGMMDDAVHRVIRHQAALSAISLIPQGA